MTTVSFFKFLVSDSNGNRLTSDDAKFYLIADSATVITSPNAQFDYIFQFSDQAAAERDAILPPSSEVLVFGDLTVNSVVSDSGYWCMVTENVLDENLLSDPNLQLVIDRSTAPPNAFLANIPIANIGIVRSIVSTVVAQGLQSV